MSFLVNFLGKYTLRKQILMLTSVNENIKQ